jgi:hypothetical protein
VHGPHQADRCRGQVAALKARPDAAGVALVEDEVQDVQHGGEPLGALAVGRHPERDAGHFDALLGAADPLRHGRLGHEERVRDLGRGQAAHGAQGQGDR